MAIAPITRSLRRVFALLLLLFAAAVPAAFWLCGSETALRWLAAQAVEASAGRLRLEGVRGSLYGPLHVSRFAYVEGDRHIDGEALELDWSPHELLFAHTLLVDSIALRRLAIDTGNAAGQAPQLPQTLRLPLQVEVRSAQIESLALASEGDRRELRALKLALRNPDGRLHLDASAQTPWGKADAELTLAESAPYALNGRVDLAGSYTAHAYAVHATLAGTLADVELSASASAAAAQAQLRARLAPLARQPLQQTILHLGQVDARKFDATLPRTELSAQLELRASGENDYAGNLELVNALPGTIDAARVPLRAARLAFVGRPEALTLNDLDLDFGDAGRFSGTGELRQGQLRLRLDTGAFDLRGVYAKLAATKLAGSLVIGAQGEAQEVQADLREGGYSLRLDAARRGDAVRIRSAQIFVAGGEMNLSGELSLAGARAFRAEGKLLHFDPSRLGDYPAALLDGAFSASGQLTPSPEAALSFTTGDSRYRGRRLQGSGKVRVSAQRIWDSDIAFELGANQLTARGAFGAPGDALSWRFDGDELAALAPQLSGRVRASGRLEGTLDAPSGTIRVRGSKLAWARTHRVAEFSAEGKMEQGMDGPLALSATLRDYRSPTLSIDAATASAAGRRSAHRLQLALRNQAFDAHAALEGAWRPDNGWSGRILSFDNRGRYAAELEAPASLAVQGGDFSLGAAALRFAQGTVRIAELRRDANGVSSAGTLAGIDTAYLLGLLAHPPEVSSTLTLDGRWKLAAADRVNGELELRRAQGDLSVLSEPATALGLARFALTASVTNDSVSAQLDTAGAVFGKLSASLRTTLARRGDSVGLADNAPLSFEASIDTPALAWASALLGGRMTVDGKLNGRISGQGTLAQPQLSGSISGDALEFEFPEQGIYLKDGSLRAHLQDNALVLDQLLLHGGAGRLEGKGSVDWDAGKTGARIALKADKLEVVKRLDRQLVLSGDAMASLQDRRVRASAKLKADRGEIILPDADMPALSSDVVVLGRADETERKGTPFATELELDLDLGEHFQLKGRGIGARIAGAVKVHAASDAQARATGSLHVADGSYSAYGQRLAIERGFFSFAGPLDNPGLDILALRKGQTVEAGVAIRGTALAPEISLYSNPSVPDSEKLSWLVLGHGLEGSNRSDIGLLQSAAGALLARGDSISLQQRIAHAAGLDELSVGSTGAGGLESTVLTLGKRLSSRAYLSFEQGLAAATNLVKITYTLTPRLSLRAQTGSENALDAFYTFSFK